jgi:hypothetical protein
MEVVDEGLGHVLDKDVDGENPGIDEIAENKINDAVFSTEGNSGFAPFVGQGNKALALSTGHDKAKNF